MSKEKLEKFKRLKKKYKKYLPIYQDCYGDELRAITEYVKLLEEVVEVEK